MTTTNAQIVLRRSLRSDVLIFGAVPCRSKEPKILHKRHGTERRRVGLTLRGKGGAIDGCVGGRTRRKGNEVCEGRRREAIRYVTIGRLPNAFGK